MKKRRYFYSPEPEIGGGADSAKEKAKLLEEIADKVKSTIKDKADAAKVGEIEADLKKLGESLKEFDSTKYAALVKEHAQLMADFNAFKEQAKTTDTKMPLSKALSTNKEKIKSIAKGISSEEFEIKALTQRSSIANNEQAVDLTNIGQLATRKLSLYDIFTKITVGDGNHNGVIRYYDWDEATIARAAAAVAEGAPFPESTAKFKKGSISLQKIGDTLPVTEEFFEDEAQFAAELQMFLDVNVQLEIDRQLADGDGTSNTIKGLKSSVNAYSLPGTPSVVDPSIYDLIIKLSEAITETGGSKYNPDFVVMHISDINKMRLKKDKNNNYVLPPFVSRDGAQVSTVTVIESNIITANTLVLGDRRFARIYEKPGIVLSRGLKGDQFIEDEMTLKARKRLAFLIREADKGGFLKVTDIELALSALEIV